MATKQPITIQSGSFVCTLYDVDDLMRLPLANVRKLWKIMFTADYENEETIQTIRDWLPRNIENTNTQKTSSTKAAVAARAKAQKLQTIFNKFTTK